MQVVKPDLPSSVLRWVGERQLSVAPSFNETVATIGPHPWGPLLADEDGGKLYPTLPAFEADYGTEDSPLRDAVVGAFVGGGVPGEGGAGGVIVGRINEGADPAQATINAGATPSLRLTARYAGAQGNDITRVIEDDPVDASRDVLRLLFKGAEVEKFTYDATDINALAAAINARPSKWVTAEALATGTALTHASAAFAGGSDGDALTAATYTAAQRALEFKRFSVFAPAALNDVAIKVQLAAWIKSMASEMRPIRAVFGGPAAETVDDGLAELAANPSLRDPQIVRFSVGSWVDDILEKTLSTSQLVGRIAGALVARGERSALTRALFAGLHPVGGTGPTTDELKAGRDGGLTMLRQVSNANADVAISQGVTTFIDRLSPAMPYELFSEPRIVGILNRVLRHMVEWGDDVVIGDLPVTDDTRALVRKELGKVLADLEGTGLAEPGSAFAVVDPPDDPDLADTIPYSFGFIPSRTANYLVGEGRVR